ncbi:uncharacterized protein LOC124361250 [Homalodisca vitripennis]|uniref:uncharacterized protein LOC124361250 n=1 Tax=Homalodisca vitripennis TaxID=197043 RepID=UPI001EEC7115|nr:uncharacterized protein LOC124361250 [Homalodisca vitripennis]
MTSRAVSQITILTQKGVANNTLAPLIVPPDGGWGWIIVFVGFFSYIVVDGVSFCFYLYRDPMVHDLGILPGDISFLSALFTGFYFFGGIAACSIGNYWGFRIVMVLGASFSCLAFGLGYIFNDILHFYISIGFVGGISAGFISVAGSLPAGFYFDKKRSLVMGFVACGSGMGAFVVPFITKLFMDEYGWRLTYLFHASLFVLLILLGFLIRPLKPVLVVIRTDSFDATMRQKDSVDMTLFRMPTIEATSIGPTSLVRSGMLPTISQMARMSGTTLSDDSRVDLTFFRVPKQPSAVQSTFQRTSTLPNISQVAQDADNISIMVRDTGPNTVIRLREMTQSRILQPSVSLVLSTVAIEREELPPIPRQPWYKCGCFRSPYPSIPERPMHRTDLYYTGSLNRLDEYVTRDRDLDYHLHVTEVPTYFEVVQDLTRTYTTWCCHQILHGIRSLLDYTLLKSPTFDFSGSETTQPLGAPNLQQASVSGISQPLEACRTW